jgi:hypothetical protein
MCLGMVLQKLPNYANIITCYLKSYYVNSNYRTCGYPARRTDECICVQVRSYPLRISFAADSQGGLSPPEDCLKSSNGGVVGM